MKKTTMISNENVTTLFESLCECEPNIKFKCPICMIREVHEQLLVEHAAGQEKLKTALEERRFYFRQNKAMRVTHILHRNALDNYYHLLYKRCPCLTGEGKCESPWGNTLGQK